MHAAPEPERARTILFDEAYYEAKASIMTPVAEFYALIDARTAAAVAAAQDRAQLLLTSILVVLGTVLTWLAFCYGLARRKLASLARLEHETEGIGDPGHTSTFEVHSRDEIGKVEHPPPRRHRAGPGHLPAAGRADRRQDRRGGAAGRREPFLVHHSRGVGAGRRRGRRQDLRGLRALVVDDNATNRTVLARQLAAWGVEPDLADDGPSALKMLRSASYDVAILDMHMPGDGRAGAGRGDQGRPCYLLDAHGNADLVVADRRRCPHGRRRHFGPPTQPVRQDSLRDLLSQAVGGKAGQTAPATIPPELPAVVASDVPWLRLLSQRTTW